MLYLFNLVKEQENHIHGNMSDNIELYIRSGNRQLGLKCREIDSCSG